MDRKIVETRRGGKQMQVLFEHTMLASAMEAEARSPRRTTGVAAVRQHLGIHVRTFDEVRFWA